MKITYEQHDTARALLEIARLQSSLAAAQVRFMLLPFQAYLNSAFNPMALWNGTKVKYSGLDTIARQVPGMADFTEKLPASAEIAYRMTGEDEPAAPEKGDRKNLKLTLSLNEPHRNLEALAALFNEAAHEFPKPDYRIDSATIQGRTVPVEKSILLEKDFADLILFDTGAKGPLLYIGTPLSGHYGTLVRETIQSALNAGFRVAVYDTKNARDVPAAAGDFGLEDCVDYHRKFISHLARTLDPRVNVQAICQATVPVSMAAATLAAEKSPYTPFTLTLDAGPINTKASMTEATDLARRNAIGWFRENLIDRVPRWYEGAGRTVYPGFRQLTAFIAMNPGQHAHSFYEMFNHLVNGNGHGEDYKKMRAFYDEYLSVCDLPAKFYLETVEKIFIDNDLAEGRMTWRGRPVDLAAYTGPLLTKEASLDDIAAPGQTMFAHELMPGAKGYHYTLEGAGHYGIFSGSKARDRALPVTFAFIHDALKKDGQDPGPLLDSYGRTIHNPPMPKAYDPKMLESTLRAQEKSWASYVANRGASSLEAPQISVTLPAFAKLAA